MAKLPAEALEFFRRAGAKGGKVGGKKRMETMTAEQRSEVAKKGATARWKNAKKATKKKPAAKKGE